ncbi:MAG: hypothetical protein IT266_05435 [Saprospiraceae bacterium]|nr:hypothetical protein [Saprospiraceae bacterium]
MPKWALIFSVLMAIGLQTPNAQEIRLIHQEGKVQVCNSGDPESSARTMEYGRVIPGQKILIGKKSKAKLIREGGDVCELVHAGSYPVESLRFVRQRQSDFFSRLASFIVQFFEPSHPSEVKASYKSTINAISRSGSVPPMPEFPFEGAYPAGHPVWFRWAASCDTCRFVLELSDLKTRSKMLERSVRGTSYTCARGELKLSPGLKYFWTVRKEGTENASTPRVLTIVAKEQYERSLRFAEEELKEGDLVLQPLPRAAYLMQALDAAGLPNFSVLYANEVPAALRGNEQLRELAELHLLSMARARMQQN